MYADMAVTLKAMESYDLKLKENDEWDENENTTKPDLASSHARFFVFLKH